jgi:uncharacterized membrane protein
VWSPNRLEDVPRDPEKPSTVPTSAESNTASSAEAAGPAKGRVEAFSDGVFAVAITLLILDITLDHKAAPGRLWQDLGELGYHYAAYAISFLTIGVMWVTHHRLLTNVAAVDHGLMYRNLFLLAVIAFIPFPTGILSEYVHGEGTQNMRAAVGLYGLTMIALGVAFTLLWLRVYRQPALRTPEASSMAIRTDLVRAGVATLIYVAATAITLFAPWLSLIIFAVLVVGFAVAGPRAQAKASH